jgi:hypothetical protein
VWQLLALLSKYTVEATVEAAPVEAAPTELDGMRVMKRDTEDLEAVRTLPYRVSVPSSVSL